MFRLKVSLRNENTVNGFITGFIEAFDRHWNLVLSDAFHIWKRKKFHYCPTSSRHRDDNEHVDDETEQDLCIKRLKKLKIHVPELKVKSLNRKFVECSRQIDQIVIRGEQIAIVTFDQQNK